MGKMTVRSTWDQVKAYLAVLVLLLTIIGGMWAVESRYAKSGEFKQFRNEYQTDKIMSQIWSLETQMRKMRCDRPPSQAIARQCQYLRGRLDYWQKELARIQRR